MMGNIKWGPFVTIVPDQAKYHMNCDSIYKLPLQDLRVCPYFIHGKTKTLIWKSWGMRTNLQHFPTIFQHCHANSAKSLQSSKVLKASISEILILQNIWNAKISCSANYFTQSTLLFSTLHKSIAPIKVQTQCNNVLQYCKPEHVDFLKFL